MRRAAVHPIVRVLVVAVVLAACNRPHRVSQGITLASGAAGTGSLAGKLVSYQTGAPLSGATVRLSSVTAVSTAAGDFELDNVPDTGAAVVTVALPGYVFRGVAFTLQGARSGLSIDMLQDAAPFSLDFYRQFARGALFNQTLQATAPWTVAPNFHFGQLTLDTGTRVPDEIIQQLEANFTASVPELTGGKLQVGSFAVSDDDVPAQSGWVNITFYTVIPSGSLGNATIGGNQGTMIIRYDPTLVNGPGTNPYNCASIPLQVADQLIAQSMGYWPTVNTINDEFSGFGCPGSGRPANTLYHATLMYSRPAGNTDPDVDPAASAHVFAPFRAARPAIDPSRFIRGR